MKNSLRFFYKQAKLVHTVAIHSTDNIIHSRWASIKGDSEAPLHKRFQLFCTHLNSELEKPAKNAIIFCKGARYCLQFIIIITALYHQFKKQTILNCAKVKTEYKIIDAVCVNNRKPVS